MSSSIKKIDGIGQFKNLINNLDYDQDELFDRLVVKYGKEKTIKLFNEITYTTSKKFHRKSQEIKN